MIFSDIKNAFILVIDRPYKIIANFDHNITKVFLFCAMPSHAFVIDEYKNSVFLIKVYIYHLLTNFKITNH